MLRAASLIVVFASTSLAQVPTALDAFKSLKGTWTIVSGDKTLPFKMTYDLASKDSVVTEYFGKELSAFYQDKDALLMTHFCNAGNQPRLKLSKTDNAKSFEFEMMDITNVKDERNEPHVQRIIYKITAPDQLELKIVWRKGKEEESENYVLTRDK